MLELEKIQNFTSCIRIAGEPTITYVCRIVNVLTDDMFYSLNAETKAYINNTVIQVTRKKKYLKGE